MLNITNDTIVQVRHDGQSYRQNVVHNKRNALGEVRISKRDAGPSNVSSYKVEVNIPCFVEHKTAFSYSDGKKIKDAVLEYTPSSTDPKIAEGDLIVLAGRPRNTWKVLATDDQDGLFGNVPVIRLQLLRTDDRIQ